MRNIRLLLIGFALPIILTAYVIWMAWFQVTFNRVPNERDEVYFIDKHVNKILVVFYSVMSAWLCMYLLT
jgi:hypothetical protein